MKRQRVISAIRGWDQFAKSIFELFFQGFVMKPIGLFKRGGRVPKSFFFEKPNKTMSFFEVLFKALCQNTLLKFFYSG